MPPCRPSLVCGVNQSGQPRRNEASDGRDGPVANFEYTEGVGGRIVTYETCTRIS